MTHWMLDQQFMYRDQVVRYRTFGDGPPIVLIHGTPFSSWVWHRIAPHLARDRKVHVYDLLGYGQSERRDGQDVSLGVQNGLLAALLDHWQLNAPDVVAHDFGGATALRAHLIDGCDYASLTLIDPVAVAPWGSPFVRHVREHAAAFEGLPAYIHEAVVNAYIRGSIARTIAADELAPYVAPWLGEVGQPAFYRQIAQMDQRYTDEVESRYSQMRCRTQILWGEQDEWIPIERGRHLASVIPDARFQPVPNAGHLVQEDAPEAIVAAVLRWLG
ncbi:alpha/beta hydrolase [Paraburkholderia sp. Tr-20389]|uniref:alpha/beta fold hydrolase n=1 Tax=Paraburkholderia sp. Tr-20389 TaxID=2703903 RepID=UPI00198159FE|nr:alpha/beta hydrolase [Paraburkholderia sp. Tr-20389]MBN3759142.1 alpha/beta hydrolase [Paraburkholderia sp. Tr-20389]